MYNLITLNVHCPHCGKSLMDEDQKIDSVHGIHLEIEISQKRGSIWLSAIYESYNYISDVDTPKNEVAVFFCPFCNEKITGRVDCDQCKAPMVSLDMEIGGKLTICSRAGCKNHYVKLVDLTSALKYLFKDQSLVGKTASLGLKTINDDDEISETIKTGTFLPAYCSYCKKSIIEDELIRFIIINQDGEEGLIMLSPYLNVFTSKSTIFLPEGKSVKDIRCIHCQMSFMVPDGKCEKCGDPIAKFSVGTQKRLADFYICSKKGCRWHGVSEEDIKDIILEDSTEW